MLEHADTLDPRIAPDPVEDWRLAQLIESGYPVDLAVEMAPRGDVDLHKACELVRRGCTPELAGRILL